MGCAWRQYNTIHRLGESLLVILRNRFSQFTEDIQPHVANLGMQAVEHLVPPRRHQICYTQCGDLALSRLGHVVELIIDYSSVSARIGLTEHVLVSTIDSEPLPTAVAPKVCTFAVPPE